MGIQLTQLCEQRGLFESGAKSTDTCFIATNVTLGFIPDSARNDREEIAISVLDLGISLANQRNYRRGEIIHRDVKPSC